MKRYEGDFTVKCIGAHRLDLNVLRISNVLIHDLFSFKNNILSFRVNYEVNSLELRFYLNLLSILTF